MRLILASPDGLSDILQDACIHNTAYDLQREGERSEYLVRLIEAIGRQAEFFDTLLARLMRATSDDSEGDVWLMFAVIRRLTRPDDTLALSRVRRAYEAMSVDDQLSCMDDLVRLFGLPALVECAERLVGDLKDEGWRGGSLIDAFRERAGQEADGALESAKRASEALRRLSGAPPSAFSVAYIIR